MTQPSRDGVGVAVLILARDRIAELERATTQAHDLLGYPTPENIERASEVLRPFSEHAWADRGPDG